MTKKPPKSDIEGRLRWERRKLRAVVNQMADRRFWSGEQSVDDIIAWLKATLTETRNDSEDC